MQRLHRLIQSPQASVGRIYPMLCERTVILQPCEAMSIGREPAKELYAIGDIFLYRSIEETWSPPALLMVACGQQKISSYQQLAPAPHARAHPCIDPARRTPGPAWHSHYARCRITGGVNAGTSRKGRSLSRAAKVSRNPPFFATTVCSPSIIHPDCIAGGIDCASRQGYKVCVVIYALRARGMGGRPHCPKVSPVRTSQAQ
jgi:hypothetical protein